MEFLLYDEAKWLEIAKVPMETDKPVWVKQGDLTPVPAMYLNQKHISGVMIAKLINEKLQVSQNEGLIKVTHWQQLIKSPQEPKGE